MITRVDHTMTLIIITNTIQWYIVYTCIQAIWYNRYSMVICEYSDTVVYTVYILFYSDTVVYSIIYTLIYILTSLLHTITIWLLSVTEVVGMANVSSLYIPTMFITILVKLFCQSDYRYADTVTIITISTMIPSFGSWHDCHYHYTILDYTTLLSSVR